MIRDAHGKIVSTTPPLKGWKRALAPFVHTVLAIGIVLTIIGWGLLTVASEIFYAPFVERK